MPPRGDRLRRLAALEARMPTAADEERRQSDATWKAILAHPDAADLLRLLDQGAVMAEEHGPTCPEVQAIMQEVLDRLAIPAEPREGRK